MTDKPEIILVDTSTAIPGIFDVWEGKGTEGVGFTPEATQTFRDYLERISPVSTCCLIRYMEQLRQGVLSPDYVSMQNITQQIDACLKQLLKVVRSDKLRCGAELKYAKSKKELSDVIAFQKYIDLSSNTLQFLLGLSDSNIMFRQIMRSQKRKTENNNVT
jgi:hypothetical protein